MVLIFRFSQAGLSLLPIVVQSRQFMHRTPKRAHEIVECVPGPAVFRVALS